METSNFEKLVNLIKLLRSEDGCPWDREQTIKSLKEDVLDEAREVREAIEKEDYENLKEEIGDLIWGLLLMTEIAEEQKLFTLDDVLQGVIEKIIRRHPHVFGNKKAKSAEEAKKIFYEAKANEKKRV